METARNLSVLLAFANMLRCAGQYALMENTTDASRLSFSYYPFNADSAVAGRFGPHLDAPTFLCPSQTCRRIKPDGIARACPRADTGQKRRQAEAGIVTTVKRRVVDL